MENLNTLNSLVSSIKSTRDVYKKSEFSDVEKYCIEKHKATFDILEELCQFIENNFEIFYNPDDKLSYRYHRTAYSNICYGRSNVHNRVVTSYESNRAKPNFWIDDRFSFTYDITTKKVVFVHNLNGLEKSPMDYNETEYGHNIYDKKKSPRSGTDAWCYFGEYDGRSKWKKWDDFKISSFEEADNTKRYVDWDYENALDLVKQFTESIKEIAEDEAKYLTKINEVKDKCEDKNVEYKVEITMKKIEKGV